MSSSKFQREFEKEGLFFWAVSIVASALFYGLLWLMMAVGVMIE